MRKQHGFDCDTSRCRAVNYCDAYNMTGTDLVLTLGPDYEATVSDLLVEIDQDDYKCELAIFNAGNRYILGNQFLKAYYTIYDSNN